MARIKPSSYYPVKNLEEANTVLAKIAELKRKIAEQESKLNEKIDKLKADAEIAALPFQSELIFKENGLLSFAATQKDQIFTDKRSKELDYGAIGYRRSKEIKPKTKTTWKMVLGKIKDLDFKDALRIKEDVDKDELHKWGDEKLKLIGCRRIEKDTFWYEIDETKLSGAVE